MSSRKFPIDRNSKVMRYIFTFFTIAIATTTYAQPINDNCANATTIAISNSGYGLGTFVSGSFDLTNATTQSGETFYSTIQSAGQTAKSIWFKFTLPTARKCTLTLKQPTPLIAGNDAGFTIYLANSCFPTSQQADDALLASQTLFGWSANPCLKAGDYLVQVSANNSANGPVFIELQLQDPNPALYDKPNNAYDFGTINNTFPNCEVSVDVPLGCHSLDASSEICPALGSSYSQSIWYTFTTDSYFDYMGIAIGSNGNWFSSDQIFGYRLYQGDAKTQPLSALTLIDGCKNDTLTQYVNQFAVHDYRCGALVPNTNYTVQIIAHKDLAEVLRLTIERIGTQPGSSPRPVTASIAANNKLGVLPQGLTSRSDYFACNTRMSVNACGNTNPTSGVYIPAQGATYDLALWYTFELSQASNVTINVDAHPNYNPPPYFRIFNKDVSASCTNLDTLTNMVYAFADQATINCMPAGKYTMQVLAESRNITTYCAWANYLGNQLNVSWTVSPVQSYNHYSLVSSGAVDTIRRVGTLFGNLQADTLYTSKPDTFGCSNTVLPTGNRCDDRATKAIYTEFNVIDSGFVNFSFAPSWNYWHSWNIVYKGNAMSLANAQNKHFYPDSITGLVPVTPCISNPGYCGNTPKSCVTSGIYTMVNFGDSTIIGQTNTTTFQLDKRRTTHYSAALAEDMGNILDTLTNINSNGLNSQMDWYTCLDNPLTIGGQAPCDGLNGTASRTKLIYRQFYLSQPKYITISATNNYCRSDVFTLFNGKATNGVNTLSPVGSPWNCTRSASSPPCIPLPAGWYTIVSYGEGPSYANPLANYDGYSGASGDVGLENYVSISVTPPPSGPKYNRPAKACIDTFTNQPFVIKTGNRGTAAIPITDSTYQLYTEYFDCTTDTPFYLHPLKACDSISHVRVAYYVFTLPQESYIRFTGLNDINLICQVYAGNARTTPNILQSNNPIQPCVASGDWIQICKMLAGTYTLVVLVPDNYNGSAITPSIYVDGTGYSRFDHAAKAYDFGVVTPDSIWHNGKNGDVNPINPLRAPSNDIYYCTTGAQSTDPPYIPCGIDYNPNVYNNPQTNNHLYDYSYPTNFNNFPRRNLWYTFVLNGGGNCRVRINNLTSGKTETRFTVYKSDVNGTLPFSNVVSTGQVDSSVAQGLSEIAASYGYYCYDVNEVTFYRDPCSAIQERYYIIADGKYEPNYQIDVEVLWDTINSIQPNYDFYSRANVINGLNQTAPPYTSVSLGPGVYTGAKDNFTCATYSPPSDIIPCYAPAGYKTLWYKFQIATSGQLRIRYLFNGSYIDPSGCEGVLLRQIIPGDSVSGSGLMYLGNTDYNFSDGTYNWNSRCIVPGTYYLMFTGYYKTSEDLQPIIWIVDQDGDYCNDPVAGSFSGPGTVTLSTDITCHTIGEGFGEDGSNMACLLPSGADVNNYKSTWFRFDVTGNTDTFDITPIINNQTNVASNSIRYRLLYGSCSAMNTGSCFVSANTVNTFNCLTKGSYFLQVVSPNYNQYGQWSSGTVEMAVSAAKSPPGCNPVNTCFALANFSTNSPCYTDTVYFLNQGSAGDSIRYQWKLGYNNLTDTAKNPKLVYPVAGLTQTYTVKLFVTNINCSKTDSVTKTITVYKKPKLNLGPDTTVCASTPSISLNATTEAGTVYQWQDGSVNPLFVVTGTGQYYVQDSFNTCIVYDTINVTFQAMPIVNLGADMVLCAGNRFVYDATQTGATYQWNTGSALPTIDTAAFGIYMLTVTINGCSTADTINISNSVTAQPLGNDTSVCSGASIILDATTASANSYGWDDGSGGSTRMIANPGLYWVDINISGCLIRDSINVTGQSFNPPIITGDSVLTCTRMSIPLTASSSTSGLNYDWGGGMTSAVNNVTQPGLYSVTVTNPINGCNASASINVTQQITVPDASIAPPADLSCTITSVTLTASSVTPLVNYDWGGGILTNTRTVTQPNTYNVTVTDISNGCTATASATVNQNISTPDVSIAPPLDLTCTVTSVILTASSSVSGINYNWGGGITTSTNTVTVPNTYTVTVTDPVTGCSASSSVAVSQNVTIPNVSIAPPADLTCSVSSVIISASSTTASASFDWGGGITTSTNTVTQAGLYSVTVTDPANGCTVSASATVNQAAGVPNVNIGTPVDLTCTVTSVMLTASSTTPSVTYEWGGGITTATNTVTQPGLYSVTVTEPTSSCTASASVTVIQSAVLPDIAIATPVDLNCTVTSVTLTASSTTPSVSYDWGGGIITATNIVTQPGSYSVTVTDPSNSCTASASTTVNQLTSPPNVTIAPPADLTCTTSSVTLAASSTTSSIVYDWGGGVTTSTNTIILPNTYTITVTDPANGCTASASVSVIQNITIPNVNIAPPVDLTCVVTSVTISASSTTPSVTYDWGGGISTATNTVTQAGTYSVTVTDPANGCTASASTTVNQSAGLPNVSITTPLDLSCTVTSVTLTASSTTPSVTYDWGGGITTATNTVTQPGPYSVTVTEPSSSCTATASTTVNQSATPPNISIAAPVDLTCVVTSVTLTASSTTPSVTYDWGGGNTTSTNVVTQPGSYFVTVTDPVNSCTAVASSTVNLSIIAPNVSIALPSTLTCSVTSVTLSASSTTTGINYDWGGGVSGATFAVTQPNTYTVIATDAANGCSASTSVTVTQNTAVPDVTIATPDTLTCSMTSVALSASSTTPAISYSWNGGITTPTLTVNMPTTYGVTVTDPANGCTASASVSVVEVAARPDVTISSSGNLTCITTSVTLTASSTLPGVSFDWGGGFTTPTNTVSSPSTYTVTATNGSNGCSASASVIVSQGTNSPDVSIAAPTMLTCAITSTTLTASSTTPAVTYDWGGGNTTSTQAVSAPGSYSVTVSEPSSGCTASVSVTVTQSITPPDVSITPPATLTCSVTTVTLNASSTTTGVNYDWGGWRLRCYVCGDTAKHLHRDSHRCSERMFGFCICNGDTKRRFYNFLFC